jgi:hypothetical protein
MWADIATGVEEQAFTATGLMAGLTYKFRIYARNAVGYGDPSSAVSILTAVRPTAPAAPTTTVVANDVLIQWTSPSGDPYVEYGTYITGYKLMIQSGIDST